MKEFDLVIIGGGAAGLMTAARLSPHINACILEKNEKLGKKLYITGKGRCNITNLCEKEEFFASIINGQRFMFSAYAAFSAQDTVDFLGELGLETKTERGNRVFPCSDRASDVSAALLRHIEANNCKIFTKTAVNSLEKQGEFYYVRTDLGEVFRAKYVVVATGGKSYPLTGSDGGGYSLAKRFGHTITEPLPALTSLIFQKNDTKLPTGLSLKNVCATLKNEPLKLEFSDFGEMLFTENGVSGPIVLSLSSRYARHMHDKNWIFSIDLKPALSIDTLDSRILRDFSQNINKNMKNGLDELLPKSMIPFIIDYTGIDGEKKIHSLTKEERLRLVNSLKHLSFDVKPMQNEEIKSRFNEAIITCGGVDLGAINPKNMESKLAENLFFAGEILDIDALTGGFNLQIAWSTAASAAREINKREEVL